MQKPSFHRTPLAKGVALALSVSALSPAFAQDGSEVQFEEIVTIGIRGSLKASMDIKRLRDGVVDAITAEDIGDFPDTNLAESLQRITGVSIDRERGEGSRVTVRGFGPDFNLVLLNGRQMPTARTTGTDGLGRSFDFGNLASEGIASVEVYKSGKADVPTGGIGSTINITTTRPLDSPGFKASVNASGVYDDSRISSSSWTPEISGLFSNTFADDKVGVALSAVRQERDSGAATASVGGWRTFTGDTDNCWCGLGPSEWGGIPPAGDPNQLNRPEAGELYSVPQVVGYELADYNRVRTNGQATLQFRPQESLTATLDYTYSEVELDRTYNNLSAWFNFGAQETLWTDGPQASPLEYTENLTGSDFAMGAGSDAFRTENNSVGFNLLWNVSDSLSVDVDYHDSTAEYAPNSPNGDSSLVALASFTRDRTSGYFESDLPILELGLASPLTADDMIVTGSVFTNNISKMDIEQLELGGSFEFFDSSFVESIDFGVQLTEVNNRSAGSVVQRDAWGGVTQPGAISDLLTPASTAGAFDEFSAGSDPRLQTDFFTYNLDEVVARTEALMASGDATTFLLGDMGDCGTGLCPSSTFSSDRRTKEESEAVYAQLNMSTEWGDKPIDMRLGLRYEQTDVTSEALSPTFTGGLEWRAGNELNVPGASVPEITQFLGDYDVFLPNFDFKIDLTENLVGRASFSKTLTRPKYSDIQGGQTIDSLVRIDGGTGSRGNPALLPFESVNIDLSVEYYYGDANYVAVGYFHKDVENFIGDSSVTENTFDLPHPVLGPLGDEARAATGSSDGQALFDWIIANRPNEPGVDAVNGIISGVEGRDPSSPFELAISINLEEATMDGWEFVVQHNFGESGFGVIANATIVDADVAFDNFNLLEQFVLDGLSDSANLVGYYENDELSVRLAYNWRDDFLAGTGQTNVGAGPPTYVADYQQWDLTASYWINDNLQIFTDALNLTNETKHVYGRDTLQTLFAVQLGPRYNVGVRYKF